LDVCFIDDSRNILAVLPKQRQNLMFSATFSGDIRELAKGIVNNPVEISVSPENTTAKSVTQCIYPVDKSQKPGLLTHLIHSNDWQQVLIFSKTKHGANRLAAHLEKAGIGAAAIHGNKSQGARTKALADFKSGAVRALVATDIAARGLDIDQLPQVVNFDLPNVPEDYVHRIGRTGRAGATGNAVSLVCSDDFKLLADIERLIQEVLPREILVGFEPTHALPDSRLNQRPARKPRPKNHSEHRDGQRPAGNPANRSNRSSRPSGNRSGNTGRSAPKA